MPPLSGLECDDFIPPRLAKFSSHAHGWRRALPVLAHSLP